MKDEQYVITLKITFKLGKLILEALKCWECCVNL